MRMLITIAVNLYTVRVLWQILGIDNYGIYNVVGGVVMMFAFLNNAMIASSQRFISFELGLGDKERISKVFSLSITIHFLLAIIILIFAETIGLWFLNYKLNIPADRMVAANWVFQCSVVTFIINVISVPYNACIVAHEHMKAYGYLGIAEVTFKLLIVFLLLLIPGDKLILYSVLILSVALIMRTIFGIYCTHNFDECHYKFIRDSHLMRDMFAFAGWSFVGNLGFSVRDQGLNIVINLFFNVAVNAAKGIAAQVGGVISGFASSFTMALNPQITKRYAVGDIDAMMSLVFSGCKYSVLLMMVIVLPLIMAAKPILLLWLGDVAPYTVDFLKLTLVIVLIESIVNPITTSLQATGNIKLFQILISVLMIATVPIAYIWLMYNHNPYIVMYVSIFISLAAIIIRLLLLRHQILFSYNQFIRKVIAPIILTFMLAAPISWFLYQFVNDTLFSLIIYGIISVITTTIIIVMVALTNLERHFLMNLLRERFCK
ncbi:MAG: lipopolysaccharide biosynthesis protein [Bacteroides sp.]|nr:lipopolysaccharide biosynthesis protein [Bacteroides sp.]